MPPRVGFHTMHHLLYHAAKHATEENEEAPQTLLSLQSVERYVQRAIGFIQSQEDISISWSQSWRGYEFTIRSNSTREMTVVVVSEDGRRIWLVTYYLYNSN